MLGDRVSVSSMVCYVVCYVEPTVNGGGRGLDGGRGILYKRSPNLSPSSDQSEHYEANNKHTCVGVGTGRLEGDGFFPCSDGVIILLCPNVI